MSRLLLVLAAIAIGSAAGTTAPVPDAPPRAIKVLMLDGSPRWES